MTVRQLIALLETIPEKDRNLEVSLFEDYGSEVDFYGLALKQAVISESEVSLEIDYQDTKVTREYLTESE